VKGSEKVKFFLARALRLVEKFFRSSSRVKFRLGKLSVRSGNSGDNILERGRGHQRACTTGFRTSPPSRCSSKRSQESYNCE
jgi:hypothetical protein